MSLPLRLCPAGRRSSRPNGRHAAQVNVLVRQLRGLDRNAPADQVRHDLELTIRLRVLRISPAIEADRRTHEPVFQVEAEEFAALRAAAEDEAIPAGRETH